MSDLAITFDRSGIPTRVADELDHIIAAIQTWGNRRARCRLHLAAAQTISDSTETELLWAPPPLSVAVDARPFDRSYDIGGFFQGTAEASRLRIPMDGFYVVGVQVQWESATTGGRLLGIRIADTAIQRPALVNFDHQSDSGAGPQYQAWTGVPLKEGDQIYATAYQFQSPSADLDIQSGTQTTWFQVIRVTDL